MNCNHVMDPGQTVYDVRTLYVTFDVSDLLQSGKMNTIGAELGNYKYTYLDTWCNATASGGAAGCLAFLLHLHVNMSDGWQFVLTSGAHA